MRAENEQADAIYALDEEAVYVARRKETLPLR
jgi:hypothetical protein